MSNETLNVTEIFYSLQGEGGRAGTPTVFIRLQGCKTQYACFSSGVVCDTEFTSGKPYTIKQIIDWINTNAIACKDITWTGGEPLDQLTDTITEVFKNLGFHQSIETSGLRPLVNNMDYITVSPKVAEHILEKNITQKVNELRYVRHKGQTIPNPSIKADRYYLSPHSDGLTVNMDNVKHCINLCLDNPQWKLSVQYHKLWRVI
jgi:7-carboxy-7-deazaguanine synthase